MVTGISKYFKLLIGLAFAVFVFLKVTQAQVQESNDIEILSSTKDRLVLKYTPRLLGLSTELFNGKTQTVLRFENCAYLKWRDQPGLAVRKIIINVANPVRAQATIVDMAEDILNSNDLQSMQNSVHSFGYSSDINDTSFALNSGNSIAFMPNQRIQLSPPGLLRNQRVSELLLFPGSYNPKTRTVSVCRYMVVEITFSPIDHKAMSPKNRNDVFNPIYSGSIINHSVFPLIPKRSPATKKYFKRNNAKQWFRIPINREGIYSLQFQQLVAAGIREQDIRSRKLHIYYGGGRELNDQLEVSVPELREVATEFFDKNSNGIFDDDDALVFYAQGVSGWRYSNNEWKHYINHYNRENIYWLCINDNQPKEMMVRSGDCRPYEELTAARSFREHSYEEQEKRLPDNSGLDWMWDVLTGNVGRAYPVHFVDPVHHDSVRLKLRIKGLSEAHHLVDIYINGQHLKSVDLPYTLSRTITCQFSGELVTGDDKLRLKLTGSESKIGFDWYEVDYSRYLNAPDQEIIFYSNNEDTGWIKFAISGFKNPTAYLFDVSDPFAVQRIKDVRWDSLQKQVCFVDSITASDGKRYFMLAPEKIRDVSALEHVPYDLDAHLKMTKNQADYIIITHETLLGPALDKLRDHRSDPRYWPHQGHPIVMVVTTQEIYDQFSYGLVDPVAIRNFLKYAFENWQKAPSYVLLVGQATFDFKDNLGIGNSAMVPSFENGHVVSDDWFVNLTNDRFMDMIIGRLPVKSQEELNAVVDKIIRYDTQLAPGAWRSRITLVADDIYRNREYKPEDYIFIRDSEVLANSEAVQDFDVNKIYLERYPWDRAFNKPLAKDAFLKTFNTGTFYVNYLGHANWNMLAHENIFRTPSDLAFLHNRNQLPVFFAGTCETARIDDPRFTSMAELLLLHPEGGVIASIGSARWTMHQASFNVNKAFFEKLFNSRTNALTIGQALLQAKTLAGFPDQTEVMFLLGDPALRMPVPSYKMDLTVMPDTLSLQRKVIVQGKVKDSLNVVKDFNGYCSLKLYDSAFLFKKPIYSYEWPGKIIYQGQIPVEDGEFITSFYSATDTTAGGLRGRLVACAWQKEANVGQQVLHAIGALDSLIIASDTLSAQTKRDTVPPEIVVRIGERSIENGDDIELTLPFRISGEFYDDFSGFYKNKSSDVLFEIKVDDKIDRNLRENLSIDFDNENAKKGKFYYNVNDLSLGEHEIAITIFDKSLNATTWTVQVLILSDIFSIRNVMNYPNPARAYTFFTFNLSQDAFVKVKIYTVAGRCIRCIEGQCQAGYNKFPDEGWDCTDESGDMIANGVYLYKIIAKAQSSPFVNLKGRSHLEVISKLFIMR